MKKTVVPHFATQLFVYTMPTRLAAYCTLLLLCMMGWAGCSDAAADYHQIVADNTTYNTELLQSYRAAQGEEQRSAVLRKTRNHVFNLLNDHLFSYWYGTSFATDGNTTEPRVGNTSASNLVAVLLSDTHFNVDRSALAQQSPQQIIRTFCDKGYVRSYTQQSMDSFVQQLHELGGGLYLLALDDNHIGFLCINACGTRFIHASPTLSGVKNEDAALCDVIRDARTRTIGLLLDNDWTVRKWLAHDAFATAQTQPNPAATPAPEQQPAPPSNSKQPRSSAPKTSL